MLRLEPEQGLAFLSRQPLDGNGLRTEPCEAVEQRLEQLGVELLRKLGQVRGTEHQDLCRLTRDLFLVQPWIECGRAGSKGLRGSKRENL